MATNLEALRERLRQVREADAAAQAAKSETRRVKEPKTPNQCLCGCGGDTMSRFVPGHDAKLKSRLLTAARDDDEEKALEALQRLDELGWAHFFVPRTKPERKTVAA
ncbi:MAG TPA: hypothetical protein VFK94_06595 [Patescibacteria group bacterium]|nr:hypothetical protein [Patescibacteria group bacterium]